MPPRRSNTSKKPTASGSNPTAAQKGNGNESGRVGGKGRGNGKGKKVEDTKDKKKGDGAPAVPGVE
jgi:hypothetical protein